MWLRRQRHLNVSCRSTCAGDRHHVVLYFYVVRDHVMASDRCKRGELAEQVWFGRMEIRR